MFNQNRICSGAISGSETFATQEESRRAIIQCFDKALAQCAANTDFTNCIQASNEAIMEKLNSAHKAFNLSTLESPLPGRRRAWEDFEESLRKLRETRNAHTDAQMEIFRDSFFAALKINALR